MALGACLTGQTNGSGVGISPGAYYTVMNVASGGCLDDTGGSTANGTVLQQWQCAEGNTNQRWMFMPTTDGAYKVSPFNSQTLTWNVADMGKAPGAKMQMWAYGGGLNEQFIVVRLPAGNYEFAARNSGLCLSVPGGATTNGMQLQIDRCDGSTHEMFMLTRH
jgi:hypothetical protein